jgi:predicted transcriptional regulator
MIMEARVSTIYAILLLVSFMALSILIIGPDPASAIPQIVDIEKDLYFISVDEDSGREIEINVSVRSPSNQNSVFLIESKLVNGPFWSSEHPERIFLEPFEEWSFKITIRAPAGEAAEREVELSITVSSENGMVTGDDECSIKVLPFISTEILMEDDFLIDQPASGSFRVNIRNSGNIEIPIGLKTEDFMDPGDSLLLDRGETQTINVGYDLTGLNEEISSVLTSFSGNVEGGGLSVRFIPDGSRIHILFSRGPFLVLLPGLNDRDSVKVLSLGGSLSNVGIEVVGGEEGVSVGSEKGIILDSLEREELDLDGMGFSGIRILDLRAYGYVDDERIVSNTLKIPVTGESASREGITTRTLMYAGGSTAGAGAVLIGTIAYLYSASEVFRYKWLLLAFIPLYSTVHGEKVLDHFFRGRLFEYIKENPGSTFTALKDHFDVNNGTLTYHLHKLEREDLIVHRNIGKYKLFYADGIRIKGVEAVISPIDREIMNLITGHPGISSGEIMIEMTGERSGRTISRHLKQLERKGFISSERKNGRRIFFITGELERVLLPGKGVLDMAEVTGLDA